MSSDTINTPRIDEKSWFTSKDKSGTASDANTYASFDDAFIQSDTMKDFTNKLNSKTNPIPKETDASKINNRLDNLLKSTKKDKMDKNIDELVSFYGNNAHHTNPNNVANIPQQINTKHMPTKPNIVKNNSSILKTIIIVIVVLAILYFAYKYFFQNKAIES